MKKELEIKNQVEDISSNLEKIKDLSVILSEYFNQENFEPIRKMKKEGKEPRLEILTSELYIFRRNFEEYGTLLFEIIEKIGRTQKDCNSLINKINDERKEEKK